MDLGPHLCDGCQWSPCLQPNVLYPSPGGGKEVEGLGSGEKELDVKGK